MIQLAADGRVPAAPVKSSLQTVLQPAGGGGTAACAVMVTPASAVVVATSRTDASRRRRTGGAAVAARGGGMDMPLCGDGSRERSLRVVRPVHTVVNVDLSRRTPVVPVVG